MTTHYFIEKVGVAHSILELMHTLFETEEAMIELWTGHAEQQLKSPLSQAST